MHYFHRGKTQPKDFWAIYVNFIKLPKVNIDPIVENMYAQSGHPERKCPQSILRFPGYEERFEI
jgi:hypothetical protein